MQKSIPAPSILIVEDDAIALHSMRDYLSRAGFNVRTAGNGWDAVKRLKDGPVDLVLAELSICEGDGCNLREKLMLNPGTRDIPFFFLAPQDRTDVLVRALRSGVDDCITKPFDPVVLVARVQAVLERRRTYEEMVRVDPLTRLLNRRTMENEIREELNRVKRYKRSASIVLLDVDDFVQVNNDNGMAMGDLLLTCLSGVILTTVRAMDRAGRYHGEMFLLFLPETDDLGAEILAKRVQSRLATIADALAGFKLAFSCGIICAPADGEDWDVLQPRVEHALQVAKQRGKGSVVVWGRDVSDGMKPGPGITEI